MTETQEQAVDLNPRGVIAPLMSCLHETMDVTKIALKAIDEAALSEKVEVAGSKMNWIFHGGVRTDEDKRASYENWQLSKGLQELARAVRECLEQAYVYCCLVEHFKENNKRSTVSDVRRVLRRKKRDANDMYFPDLMKQVSNKCLSAPLDFVDQFLSLQKIRNAIEHRNGRVTADKVDKVTEVLTLSWPRMKMYYEKAGQEIEVGPGSVVDSGGPEKTVQLKLRLVVEDRQFKLGDQIVLKREEFYDIAWGCWLFAERLVTKLPKL